MMNRSALTVATYTLACLGLFADITRGDDNLWQTDFDAAKGQAQSEKKLLLVNFTGTDWCVFCKQLKKEVFDTEAFQTEAPKQFVLVELDFPRQKELPEKLKEQNARLARHYEVQGFPSVLVLDADGQAVARTGYRRDAKGADYVKHLSEFAAIHQGIVDMKEKLAKLQGAERAKVMDRIVSQYDKLGVDNPDIAKFGQELIALDPENKDGFKSKYTLRSFVGEVKKLKGQRKYAEALAVVEKAQKLPGLTGEQLQDLYAHQEGECRFALMDFAGLVACLKKARTAAPESVKVAQIEALIKRFGPPANAQEAVAQARAAADKAEGIDRAKLLDHLVDAQIRLNKILPEPKGAQIIEKLTHEIIALDPDNKAGLKTKHEFAALMTDAGASERRRSFDKALSSLNQALALPGVTGEQIQSAQILKGNCHLAQNENRLALDSFKKALEAAPDGPQSGFARSRIESTEKLLEAKDSPK